MPKQKKFIIILITCFLTSCSSKSVGNYDGEAMLTLVSLYFLCQKLSAENSTAECTFINLEKYGVLEKSNKTLNPDINIQISIINRKFSATASHFQSKKVFSVNSSGKIVPLTT